MGRCYQQAPQWCVLQYVLFNTTLTERLDVYLELFHTACKLSTLCSPQTKVLHEHITTNKCTCLHKNMLQTKATACSPFLLAIEYGQQNLSPHWAQGRLQERADFPDSSYSFNIWMAYLKPKVADLGSKRKFTLWYLTSVLEKEKIFITLHHVLVIHLTWLLASANLTTLPRKPYYHPL